MAFLDRAAAIAMALLFATPLLSCSTNSSNSAAAPQDPGNGVDDVKGACQIRAQWMHAGASPCSLCTIYAPIAACSCDSDPSRGKCLSQAQAKATQTDCTDAIAACLGACAPQDCACVDGCYTGHAACRAVASALDGCVAAACDSLCR